jgi:signal peptidase I
MLLVTAVGLHYSHRFPAWRAAVVSVLPFTLLVTSALTLRWGVVEAFKMPSDSMLPTLCASDHIFVSKLAYGLKLPGGGRIAGTSPTRADVIVFEHIDDPQQYFLKRVVAVPGDVLESVNGRPVINGWQPPECHVGSYRLSGPAGASSGDIFVEFLDDRAYLTMYDEDRVEEGRLGPWVVAADEVWVFGDNRTNSADSRTWRRGQGAGVPYRNVQGRVSFLWMSFDANGAVTWDRFGSLGDTPRLPEAFADLEDGLKACLDNRPPPERTRPPKRR